MSEYTQNDDITVAERATARQPLIELTALISACRRGIDSATRLIDEENRFQASCGVSLTTVVPDRLTQAITRNPSQTDQILTDARLHVRPQDAHALLPLILEAVSSQQPRAFENLGRMAAASHQNAMARVVLHHACEAARNAGATEIQIDPARGYLLARVPGSTARARVDVRKAAEGSVSHHLDLEGFHGDSCQVFREAYVMLMEERGICLRRPTARIRKNHAARAIMNANHQRQGGAR